MNEAKAHEQTNERTRNEPMSETKKECTHKKNKIKKKQARSYRRVANAVNLLTTYSVNRWVTLAEAAIQPASQPVSRSAYT
jgi:hypothetical protein